MARVVDPKVVAVKLEVVKVVDPKEVVDKLVVVKGMVSPYNLRRTGVHSILRVMCR